MNTYTQCRHCSKQLGPLKKGTVRLHQRDCLQNPNRRTWSCKACQLTFAHGSGFYKHNVSSLHLHTISGTDVPAASKPKTPKVITKSKLPQKRKQALVHPPLQSVFSRNTLILPETTDNYDAVIYPMLNGVPEHRFSVIMADPPFQY